MPDGSSIPAAGLLRSEMRRMGLTQAWLARQLGVNHATVWRWCSGEQTVPRYVAFTLHLLQLLHDQDARAEQAHVDWLLGLLQSKVKPTDQSEAHVAWLLHLIVHGTVLAADAPVLQVIQARSKYLKRKRRPVVKKKIVEQPPQPG